MTTHPSAQSDRSSSALDAVVARVSDGMWLPDVGIIHLVLAAVAANLMGSPPVWLLIVAPPSSGKTEILDSLLDLPSAFAVSTLTEAGLLTGSTSRADGATGGLLRLVGDWGLLVISDFTTLLSEHGSTRNRIFALLREIYDGMLRRVLGSDGGRVLEWRGHVGVIAATTEAIDAPMVDQGTLGERWCYFRPPEMTADDELLACRETDRHAGHLHEVRAERRRAVAEFFAGLSVPNELPPISEMHSERLATLAGIGTRCRSSVVRDGYSREIQLVPAHERSIRLYRQLRQFHAGFLVIGAPEYECWRLLVKVALDGIHPGRRAVLNYLMADPGDHATAAIRGHCRLPETPVRRHLQDLNAHGVLDLTGQFPERWSASEWLREHWWAIDRAQP